ncbi:MAG: alpha/beta hydrolase, partial [bacterium]|nr:alpha/beta hydrolase [bacterium]
ACKETGATVHAFNFPGTGLSTGKVREANDLTNAGLSVVRSLLKQGINPDDIILQGDCYGAGVALEVKEHLKIQADINVRLVMNNAFKSFKAAICDMITQSPWLPHQLKNIVKKLLEFTGWHLTPGKKYRHADPYQCHIQHIGDQTLSTSTLSDKVSRYRSEIFSGQTTSLKREAISDTCPEEYKSDRDILDNKHIVRVKESEKERLGKKFGYDKFGRINAHFADLCELEMLNGQSVYTGYINDYLERSDKYIKNHPQNAAAIKAALNNIHYVHQNPSVEITRQEADEMNLVSELINEAHKIAPIDDFNDNIPTGEPPQI